MLDCNIFMKLHWSLHYGKGPCGGKRINAFRIWQFLLCVLLMASSRKETVTRRHNAESFPLSIEAAIYPPPPTIRYDSSNLPRTHHLQRWLGPSSSSQPKYTYLPNVQSRHRQENAPEKPHHRHRQSSRAVETLQFCAVGTSPGICILRFVCW